MCRCVTCRVSHASFEIFHPSSFGAKWIFENFGYNSNFYHENLKLVDETNSESGGTQWAKLSLEKENGVCLVDDK